jgi:hypothetical protein
MQPGSNSTAGAVHWFPTRRNRDDWREELNARDIAKQLHQFLADNVRFARVLQARRRDMLAD